MFSKRRDILFFCVNSSRANAHLPLKQHKQRPTRALDALPRNEMTGSEMAPEEEAKIFLSQ